jgi:plasmid stabilization system protein ParE
MDKKYKLELLTPAQCELEGIARVHLELSGPLSARKITDRIYTALEKLRTHPNMGIVCRDKQLAMAGYRMLICGNYLCFYRQIGVIVFVCHIVDGRADYPKLLSDLERAKD